MSTIISVTAYPSSKATKIESVSDNHIKVRLTAAPSKGEANKQLIKLLAGQLKVSRNRLEIIRGHNSSHKLIKISD